MKYGLFVIVTALIWPSYASAYNWPIKPFDESHPIQGNFNDPRMTKRHFDEDPRNKTSFHSGIDIAAPEGTPVYAVLGGKARRISGSAVSVRISPEATFEYWHIIPAVRTGDRVSRYQLLGWVARRPEGRGGEHVHLSEWRNGEYINPRRPGGISPDPDDDLPIIRWVNIVPPSISPFNSYPTGLPRMDGGEISLPGGVVGLWVDTYDNPISQPPAPWNHIRLSPTVVSWWLKTPDDQIILSSKIVADFRYRFRRGPLDRVYAPGTIQNGPREIGRYYIWLEKRLDTSLIPDGIYILVVQASDTAGNKVRRGFPLRIENNTPPSD